MAKKSLLDLAKEVDMKPTGRRHTFTEEDLELALAWANDEITMKQLCGAKKIPQTGARAYNYIALALREAMRRNKK